MMEMETIDERAVESMDNFWKLVNSGVEMLPDEYAVICEDKEEWPECQYRGNHDHCQNEDYGTLNCRWRYGPRTPVTEDGDEE